MSASMRGSSSTSGQPPNPDRGRCREDSLDDASDGLPAEQAPPRQQGEMGMPRPADGSLSGETSSEEMIPDHLLPRRIPPVPPLPRRLRSVQISTSGASTVDKVSDRGRVIRHMDDLRAKLMQALTKRAKISPLNVPGRLYRCHVHCLPAPNSALLRATLCKVGRPCRASVPCRGWRVRTEHLICCSRPWSALSIMDHAQDCLDGCPTLQAQLVIPCTSCPKMKQKVSL